MEAPRVFVSHAREDKDRFVLGFATKLREKSVDAWLDRWEMRPGDSLVRKIFDDGIGQAEAVIVVLSEHSINKPWVRKELDVSTVRQIEDGIKLIPVVIGNVEKYQIPTSLRDTLWVRVRNLDQYDAELSEIVDAIHGRRERPPLGQQPEYTRTDLSVVPELRPSDSQILKLCCEMEMQRGEREAALEGDAVIEEAERADLHRELAVKSMKLLEGRGYLRATYTLGNSAPFRLTVTDLEFDEYARVFLPGYDSLIRSVGLEVVNHDAWRSDAIAQSLDTPQVIVEHILALFESQGWIDIRQETTPWMDISNVSPELERWLEETAPSAP
jgi:hypothetical protein